MEERSRHEEENLLRENLTHDEKKKDCIAKYPVIGDATKLRDNRLQ